MRRRHNPQQYARDADWFFKSMVILALLTVIIVIAIETQF